MIRIIVLPIMNIIFGLFLLINNGYSLDNKTYVVQNNKEKIDLVYYDRFPYKKDYNGIKMPECTRAPARKGKKTGDVLLCKEHITLLRPASVIKLWQRQQRLKGYIPFSMKEFGIINVHAYITGVKEYTPVMKNTITPDSNHVTGKFIRYAPEVNRYTVKDKQTNMTSTVNATPNHPFYVINKHAFVPISKVLPSDSLVTLSNHEAHLIRSGINNFPFETNSKKNILTRVYNIEIEKKHVYFISRLNLLAHNPCPFLYSYYLFLKKQGIIKKIFLGNDSSIEISVRRRSIHLLSGSEYTRDIDIFNLSGGLEPEILEKIHRLGFGISRRGRNLTLEEMSRINMEVIPDHEIIVFRPIKPIAYEKYEEEYLSKMRDYYAEISDATVSSTGTNIVEDKSCKVVGKITRGGDILYGLNMKGLTISKQE